MSATSFEPIADRLREAVLRYYAERGEELTGEAGVNTLETNSGLAERRGAPLAGLYRERSGRGSLEGLRVVDLGCGFGALAVYFAYLGATVAGIDPNGSRLEVGRSVAVELGLDAAFDKGDMRGLALSSEAFDLAVLNNSLCYLVARADRRSALAETRRVLVPGGWVVIRNPNRWHPLDQFTGLPLIHLLSPHAADRLIGQMGRRRSRVRVLSPPAARRELEAVGFGEVRVEGSLVGHVPRPLDLVARYQHASGQRPLAP